ncbi:electron transfer flavoprotein subunit alpha/FixB family protein [Pararhizobium arenae]|uniref:electron transfer flavoprotein subunit alpha/FixB family protein n=1 Tax=Pararhizobium arenae TaxID=1856850 RepID=UPI00094ACD64|nr:FAD-binding protein [Pararhizobium arenae]
MAILLVVDHDNTSLSEQTAKALTAASLIGDEAGTEIHLLVAGEGVTAIAERAARLAGASKVLVADDPRYTDGLAEPLAALVVSLADGYDTIVAAATSSGKDVMPRVAALLDVSQISEITEVLDRVTFKRPVYAGNAVQTVRSTDAKRAITVRTSAFAVASEGPQVPIVPATTGQHQYPASSLVSEQLAKSERPDLTSAKVVVAGGRALGSAEKFNATIIPLADRLGAAVGASRAAVDAGYAPNDWQVGQTGKIVAPDLYIACGISGAIQHLAGMKDSKVIVAINQDSEAPIFQVADYGLVGDLFELLPELETALASRSATKS